jgi:hypothetical protein
MTKDESEADEGPELESEPELRKDASDEANDDDDDDDDEGSESFISEADGDE